jgi:hypothetical protein
MPRFYSSRLWNNGLQMISSWGSSRHSGNRGFDPFSSVAKIGHLVPRKVSDAFQYAMDIEVR